MVCGYGAPGRNLPSADTQHLPNLRFGALDAAAPMRLDGYSSPRRIGGSAARAAWTEPGIEHAMRRHSAAAAREDVWQGTAVSLGSYIRQKT